MPEADVDTKAGTTTDVEAADEEPPDYIVCPLSFEVFVDPVIAADGQTYERALILEFWERFGHKSPMSNAPLEHHFLTRNQIARDAVDAYHARAKTRGGKR